MGKLRLMLGARAGAAPPPSGQYTVNNRSEFEALMAQGATVLSGADVVFNPGDYGTTILSATGLALTAPTTFRPATLRGTEIPGIDVGYTSGSMLTVRDFVMKRDRVVTGTAEDATGGVMRIHGAQNLTITGNKISSDVLADADLNGYFDVTDVTGTFLDGEAVITETLAGVANGGTGIFRVRPRSTASRFSVSDSSGLGNAGGGIWSGLGSVWLGKRLRGVTSGATAVIGAIASNTQFLVGIYGSTSAFAVNNVIVTDNELHDVKWGFGASGTNITFVGNTVHDFYTNPADFNGQCRGLIIDENVLYNGWAKDTDGQPSGTNGPHSSVLGISFTRFMVSGVKVRNNYMNIGTARALAGKGQAYATGPKVNDQGCTATGTFSGDVMTITSTPTSSFKIVPGYAIYGTDVPENAEVIEQLTGTEGVQGTYRVNFSGTIGSQTLTLQSRTEIDFSGNFIVCNGSIGLEFSHVKNSTFKYNTLIDTDDIAIDRPALYLGHVGPGCEIGGNILVATSISDSTKGISTDLYEESLPNVQLIRSYSSGPASYADNFEGVGGFTGVTPENFLEKFTPKAGAPADGFGATAHHDWSTHETSYPAWVVPRTTLATGVDLPGVRFNGVDNATRWNRAGSETLFNMSSPTVLFQSFMIDVEALDTADMNPLNASGGSDITVRRLNDSSENRLRFIISTNEGASISLDSSFGLVAADGPTLITLAVDVTNYRWCLLKGWRQDPFALVNGWPGGTIKTSGTTFTLAGTAGTTPGGFRQVDYYTFAMHDALFDGMDSTMLTKLVALDGKPADWGASGENIFGTSMRALAQGNAAAWNNPAGLQLGTATGTGGFRKVGADLTDV